MVQLTGTYSYDGRLIGNHVWPNECHNCKMTLSEFEGEFEYFAVLKLFK